MKLGIPIGFLLAAAAPSAHAAMACRTPTVMTARIEGVVREAAGGDTICVQTSPDHTRLARIRLLDVDAPRLRGPGGEGAKWALRRAARGRTVVCRMQSPGAGVCAVDGRDIGGLLSPGVRSRPAR
jgi:endonuclease YncB( thermonuclease family)